MTEHPPCPTPTKVRYPNGREAAEALAKILKTPMRPGTPRPTAIYECGNLPGGGRDSCGGWHLTTNPRPVEEAYRRRTPTPPPAKPKPITPRAEKAEKLLRTVEEVINGGGYVQLNYHNGVVERIRFI